jgi:hypothetical protein
MNVNDVDGSGRGIFDAQYYKVTGGTEAKYKKSGQAVSVPIFESEAPPPRIRIRGEKQISYDVRCR